MTLMILARLRLVTGYPEALDWSKDEIAPSNDGVFIVDVETGETIWSTVSVTATGASASFQYPVQSSSTRSWAISS